MFWAKRKLERVGVLVSSRGKGGLLMGDSDGDGW